MRGAKVLVVLVTWWIVGALVGGLLGGGAIELVVSILAVGFAIGLAVTVVDDGWHRTLASLSPRGHRRQH